MGDKAEAEAQRLADAIAKIEGMSYEDMLKRVRFAPGGHEYFTRGTPLADAFARSMAIKRAEVGQEEHIATSKRIGWESLRGRG